MNNIVGIDNLRLLVPSYQQLLRLQDWDIIINNVYYDNSRFEISNRERKLNIYINYEDNIVIENGDIYILIYGLLSIYFDSEDGNSKKVALQGIDMMSKYIENTTRYLLNTQDEINYDSIPF